MRKCVLAALTLTFAAAGPACSGCSGKMLITDQGAARAVIVLGEKPTWLEQHAACELTKYVKAVSGAELETQTPADAPAAGRNVILIGRPETNTEIKNLSDRGLVKVSPEHPGLDGFIVKTVSAGRKNYLVLSGSMDRGTLYAVYHLLENYCGVGFFWDGEYVPKATTIALGNVDVTEKPRFSYRQYLQGCVFSYTTNYWDIDDWQRELDWMAKNRLNHFLPPCANPASWQLALQPSAIVTREPAVEYANKLDIRAESVGNNVYQYHPEPEKKWKIDRQQMRQWAAGFGQRIAKIMADQPDMRLVISGWAMVADTFYWTPETVEAYLKEVPKDRAIIWDLWCDTNPMYKRYNSWFGVPWALGVLHHMGNSNQLAGDLEYLSARAREAANDPAYSNCAGIAIQPEDIHHNPLYFHYAARLGWDPNVSVKDFIASYARRRYGRKSAANMAEAMGELADSVYTLSGWPSPTYFTSLAADEDFLNEDERLSAFQRMTHSVDYVPHLQKALACALREAEAQAQNELYLNDLADICRAYLREVIDYHVFQAIASYIASDRAGFDANVRIIRDSLDAMEQVLGSRPCFWMSRKIDQATRFRKKYEDRIKFRLEKPVVNNALGGMHIPGGRDLTDDDLARLTRTFFKMGLGWAAYCRTDGYEIFKMVYSRQVKAFLQILDDSFGQGWSKAQEKQYKEAVTGLFDAWRQTGWDEKQMKERRLNTVDVAGRVMTSIVSAVKPQAFTRFSPSKRHVGWPGFTERFDDPAELDAWQEPADGDAGEATICGGKLSVRINDQSYSLKRQLAVDLGRYPILGFEYMPSFNQKPDIFAHWKDASGGLRRTRVYGAGAADANFVDAKEVYLDLGKMLALIAKPKELVGIEIRCLWTPAKGDKLRHLQIEFDWIAMFAGKNSS
ncbi:MAG: alpha-N-acetylglucosaminidase TIM-barrel domain-containing protein [Planctomycetota bacterium]|nr:alpha-N-acetylglucosaminidase TIM-barrel domain-containing protein [Planctomycetota bacterium]